jgi:hypothetical protein
MFLPAHEFGNLITTCSCCDWSQEFGNLDQAIELYEEVLSFAPTDYSALNNVGACLMQFDAERAISYLKVGTWTMLSRFFGLQLLVARPRSQAAEHRSACESRGPSAGARFAACARVLIPHGSLQAKQKPLRNALTRHLDFNPRWMG